MHGKFRLLSPGKANSHSTALPSMQCFHVSIPPAVGANYPFATDGYGIFNVRTNLGAQHTHEGGSGTIKSAQEFTWRDRETVFHPTPPGDRTQGLWIWIPTLWPLSYVPCNIKAHGLKALCSIMIDSLQRKTMNCSTLIRLTSAQKRWLVKDVAV